MHKLENRMATMGLGQILGVSNSFDDYDVLNITNISMTQETPNIMSTHMGTQQYFPGRAIKSGSIELTVESDKHIRLNVQSRNMSSIAVGTFHLWMNSCSNKCLVFNNTFMKSLTTNIRDGGNLSYDIELSFDYYSTHDIDYTEPIEDKLDKLGL